MASAQVRIAVLNPGVEISPLRLRGWLQKEAARIDGRCGPDDGAILRLFLTRKLRFAFTQEKLDAMLQAIADRYPAILRIETQVVSVPLDEAQMAEQTTQANADLQAFMQRAEDYAAARKAEAEAQQAQPQIAPIQWHTLIKDATL
jgi:hypothetical protein